MRTIETTATVTNDGKMTVQVPPDIPPGDYRVVMVIDEQLVTEKKRPPLNFPVDDWELWPGDIPMRREDKHKGETN